MQSVRKDTGFTVVELLIVLTIIAIFSGILFPLGNQFKKQARILSIKTDALRYQTSFDDYYEEYHHYPNWCPLDQWFDLSLYFPKFIADFCGEKTADNPEAVRFCEFNAQELKSQHGPSIQFFLPSTKNNANLVKTATAKAPMGKKIYGIKVLFFIPEE